MSIKNVTTSAKHESKRYRPHRNSSENTADQTQSDRNIRLGVCLAITVGAVGVYKAIESLVSPALPIIQNELHATRAEIAWVMTSVLLTGPIVTPLIGRLADIYDKKKIILSVMLVVCLGTLISSLSYSMHSLIIGQLLQGTGLSLVPLATGILKQTQRDGVMKFGNSLMVSSIYAATAFGMLVAGPIADHFHYSYLFWMPFAVMLTLTFFAWRLLPHCPPQTHQSRHIDFIGAALFALALASFLLALTYAPDWGWSSAKFIGLCGFALLSLAAFVLFELRQSDPLVELRLLQDPRVSAALVLMIVAGYVINSFFVSVPMQIQQATATGYGLAASATLTSLILVPGILVGVLAPVVNIVEHRLGALPACVMGPLIMALGFVCAMESAANLPLVVASMFCAGFGSGVTITQAMNLVTAGVPADRVGAFSGVNFVIKAIGSTSGAQIVAAVLSTGEGADRAAPSWDMFMIVFSVGLVACLLAACLAAIASRISLRLRALSTL